MRRCEGEALPLVPGINQVRSPAGNVKDFTRPSSINPQQIWPYDAIFPVRSQNLIVSVLCKQPCSNSITAIHFCRHSDMIDLYYCPTPNCQKISIALEEQGLEYTVKPIDITAGDQNQDSYLSICPNRKVPAIVDHDGPGGQALTLWESGAILSYLAEKTGTLLPTDPAARATAIQWLFWQTSYLGPMMGQLHHFVQYAPEKIDYAIKRYGDEAERLRRLFDQQIAGRDYIAGEFSIADIACLPWLHMFRFKYPHQKPYPNLEAWISRMLERPAVQKGLAVDLDKIKPVVIGAAPVTDEVRRSMFASYQND